MAQSERKEGYYWVEGLGFKEIAHWNGEEWHVTHSQGAFREGTWVKVHETRIPSPDEVPEKAIDLHAQLGKTVRIYDSNKQEWRFEVLTSRGVISYFCRLPEYAGIKPKTDA